MPTGTAVVFTRARRPSQSFALFEATAKLPPTHFLISSAHAVTGRPLPLHPFIVP